MLDVRCWMFDVGCLVVGFSLLVFRCWFLDVRCWMFDVGCSMLDVRCWMFDVGCSMLDVRCWMFDVGCFCWGFAVLFSLRLNFCSLVDGFGCQLFGAAGVSGRGSA